jgi:hypothetical protein
MYRMSRKNKATEESVDFTSLAIAPERRVAMAVIYQAIKDFKGIGLSSTTGGSGNRKTIARVRSEAEWFLRRSVEFKAWCAVAEVSCTYLRKRLFPVRR